MELKMLVDASNSTSGSTVTGAIRKAAQVTGANFNYLLATAQVESGLNPQAGAPTSSARGLFQFIDQTWLATMKDAGPALGYGRYAAAISKTASGRYEVKDPQLRRDILRLRQDPAANAAMAGAFTQANAALLTTRLGRPPTEGELYVAHFLGAGGAARLITLAQDNPNAKASAYFPHAAHANPSIFYDRATGAARSLAQVRDALTARYDVARGKSGAPEAPDEPVQLANVPAVDPAPVAAAAPVPVPDTAGLTSAFAAAAPQPAAATTAQPAAAARQRASPGRDVFHGLFQDTNRTAPVAAVVSELWGVPNAAAGGRQAPIAQPSLGGGMLDLFKDPAQKS